MKYNYRIPTHPVIGNGILPKKCAYFDTEY